MNGGFYFSETPEAVQLLWASERNCEAYAQSLKLCQRQNWVLDYSINDCGFAGTDASGWLPRPGGIGHLYPPGRIYHEKNDAKGRVHSCFVVFRGELPALRTMTDHPAGMARIVDPERKLQKLLLETCQTAAAQRADGYWQSLAGLCRILDYLSRELNRRGDGFEYAPATSARPSLAARVRRYLEHRYAGGNSIPELARELGVSASTLQHRYRAESGETVGETLLKIRLEQSLPLLLSGRRLKEIAGATGFCSEFHYSRMFKQYFGLSPRQYQQREIRSEIPE